MQRLDVSFQVDTQGTLSAKVFLIVKNVSCFPETRKEFREKFEKCGAALYSIEFTPCQCMPHSDVNKTAVSQVNSRARGSFPVQGLHLVPYAMIAGPISNTCTAVISTVRSVYVP